MQKLILMIAMAMAGPVVLGGVADVAHPRLWLTKAGEREVREKIAKDPLAAELQRVILAEADRILEARTCRYEIPDGKRLLAESRLALHNIGHCAWAWRFAGKEVYRLRAIREMEAACGLKDWNPSHFLDTAEMSLAVAWGYDWLYDTLTEKQRSEFVAALLEKGLHPADKSYANGAWWSRPKNNWAQVCGSGIGLAAAAIAERDEALATRLLDKGLRLVEACHAFYQPDGMYPEGPGYWHYGTNYHVMMLAGCETLRMSFGGDRALCNAGRSIMHLTSPTRLTFNFADAHTRVEVPSPAQGWIAGRFDDKEQAKHVRRLYGLALENKNERLKLGGYGLLGMLWLPADPGEVALPKAAVFHGEQAVAAYRTSWESDGVWFAIKGGTPAASHGHMDVGSFVFDAHGERWIHDLGSENYNVPGYFGNKRWNYFRVQNRSHNTLEIGGKLQNPKSGPCPLVETSQSDGCHHAAFSLTDAYSTSASKVVRGVTFDEGSGKVCLNDEVLDPTGEVVWRAFTDAVAEVRGKDVLLAKNGKQVTLRNRSTAGVWSIESAMAPSDAEKSNKGFAAVTLRVPAAKQVTLEVELRP